MSENGEIYTAGQKFYTAAGSDGSDKSHLCYNTALQLFINVYRILNTGPTITIAEKKDFFQTMLRRFDVYLFIHSCVNVQIIDIYKC